MEINEEFYDFIHEHMNDNVTDLLLKIHGKNLPALLTSPDYGSMNPLDFALMQIEARKKTIRKIPYFISNRHFLFPSLIAAEQASNEAVARYHASLVASSRTLLDLTAGLGIDDMTFAKAGIKVTACEIGEFKCRILRHNSQALGLDSLLAVKCIDSIEYLNTNHNMYDVIFADPARRGDSGQRVHALTDCQPDILVNMPLVMSHTDRFFIKSSPLLDLSLIMNMVVDLYHIYVVCFRGECKEVLMEIRNKSDFTGVTAIDLDWNGTISEFHCDMLSVGDNPAVSYATLPHPSEYKYLYEPNAAVMKTGDWITLQHKYPELRKADVNTHLFLSEIFYNDFPGRIHLITGTPDKKALKQLKGSKLNIVSRNHPLSAPLISRKYGIISAGSEFLYALRYNSRPVIITASEIRP